MKPEETDRPIQRLLEEVDHIPSLEWNEARVWNKIAFKLRFAWLLKLLPIALVLSITAVYILLPKEEQQITLVTQPLPAPAISVAQIDSIKKSIPVEHRPKRTPKKQMPSAKTTNHNKPEGSQPQSYRAKFRKPRPVQYQSYLPVKSIRTYSLDTPGSIAQQINLRLPQLHMVHMDVNNSFNAKNLFRSLEHKDNTYYRYRYDNRYIPEPFNNNMNLQQPYYQPQIIQYP